MATKETELDIFISHSGKDQQIASGLIDLLVAAMNIPPERIRCTSVDGYRLPAGASTNEWLQREVREAKCFIALLTPTSIRSTYVLFELGARWGANLPFIPLLAAGLNASQLEGPISGLNALSCASSSQLHQLITEIHGIIGALKTTLRLMMRNCRHCKTQMQSSRRWTRRRKLYIPIEEIIIFAFTIWRAGLHLLLPLAFFPLCKPA